MGCHRYRTERLSGWGRFLGTTLAITGSRKWGFRDKRTTFSVLILTSTNHGNQFESPLVTFGTYQVPFLNFVENQKCMFFVVTVLCNFVLKRRICELRKYYTLPYFLCCKPVRASSCQSTMKYECTASLTLNIDFLCVLWDFPCCRVPYPTFRAIIIICHKDLVWHHAGATSPTIQRTIIYYIRTIYEHDFSSWYHMILTQYFYRLKNLPPVPRSFFFHIISAVHHLRLSRANEQSPL